MFYKHFIEILRAGVEINVNKYGSIQLKVLNKITVHPTISNHGKDIIKLSKGKFSGEVKQHWARQLVGPLSIGTGTTLS